MQQPMTTSADGRTIVDGRLPVILPMNNMMAHEMTSRPTTWHDTTAITPLQHLTFAFAIRRCFLGIGNHLPVVIECQQIEARRCSDTLRRRA